MGLLRANVGRIAFENPCALCASLPRRRSSVVNGLRVFPFSLWNLWNMPGMFLCFVLFLFFCLCVTTNLGGQAIRQTPGEPTAIPAGIANILASY